MEAFASWSLKPGASRRLDIPPGHVLRLSTAALVPEAPAKGAKAPAAPTGRSSLFLVTSAEPVSKTGAAADAVVDSANTATFPGLVLGHLDGVKGPHHLCIDVPIAAEQHPSLVVKGTVPIDVAGCIQPAADDPFGGHAEDERRMREQAAAQTAGSGSSSDDDGAEFSAPGVEDGSGSAASSAEEGGEAPSGSDFGFSDIESDDDAAYANLSADIGSSDVESDAGPASKTAGIGSGDDSAEDSESLDEVSVTSSEIRQLAANDSAEREEDSDEEAADDSAEEIEYGSDDDGDNTESAESDVEDFAGEERSSDANSDTDSDADEDAASSLPAATMDAIRAAGAADCATLRQERVELEADVAEMEAVDSRVPGHMRKAVAAAVAREQRPAFGGGSASGFPAVAPLAKNVRGGRGGGRGSGRGRGAAGGDDRGGGFRGGRGAQRGAGGRGRASVWDRI